ncbi:MAG: tetratricopeptide repeat protein [Thermomicrobiales bacterium]|nr:tetratricopeptide repeat protein [Thermomicrobiales bacterium]
MSGFLNWLGVGRSNGAGDAVLLIAREVADRVRSVQSGLAEIRQPAILDRLTAQDFAGLDQVIEEQTVEDREYAIVLARLVYAAARAKGFDEIIVTAALRLDALLPGDDPSGERVRLLRDAYTVAGRAGYIEGGRVALSRLGLRALESGDTERARQTLRQQLELAEEAADTASEIGAAIALGDLLRREGDRQEARALYRRAGRAAQRLDDHHAIAEALVRQIELLPGNTDLATLAALQRQASEAARRTADLGLQSRIVLSLAETLRRNGKADEAAAQLESGLRIAHEIGDLALEGRCRSALVNLERERGRLRVVADHERALLGLEERLGNRAAGVEWATRLGSTLLALHQPADAAEAFARAEELAIAAGSSAMEQRALGGLGLAFAHLGRPTDALEYLMRALDLARRTGDDAGEARWLTSLGETLWRAGQLEDAGRALGDALTLTRNADDTELEANLLALLGRLYVARGQTPRARECLGQALELNRQLGQTSEQIANLTALAGLAAETGQLGSAAALGEQALNLATINGDRLAATRLRVRLGRMAQRRKDLQSALDHFRHAVELAAALDQPAVQAQALQMLATTQHAVGDAAAIESYGRALDLCRSIGDARCEALMGVNLGLCLASAGRTDDAVAMLRNGVTTARHLGETGVDLAARAEQALVSLGESRRAQAEPMPRPNRRGTVPGADGGARGDDEIYQEATLPPL